MNKQNVVFLYNSTLLGNKKELTTNIHAMDELHKLMLSKRSQTKKGA